MNRVVRYVPFLVIASMFFVLVLLLGSRPVDSQTQLRSVSCSIDSEIQEGENSVRFRVENTGQVPITRRSELKVTHSVETSGNRVILGTRTHTFPMNEFTGPINPGPENAIRSSFESYTFDRNAQLVATLNIIDGGGSITHTLPCGSFNIDVETNEVPFVVCTVTSGLPTTIKEGDPISITYQIRNTSSVPLNTSDSWRMQLIKPQTPTDSDYGASFKNPAIPQINAGQTVSMTLTGNANREGVFQHKIFKNAGAVFVDNACPEQNIEFDDTLKHAALCTVVTGIPAQLTKGEQFSVSYLIRSAGTEPIRANGNWTLELVDKNAQWGNEFNSKTLPFISLPRQEVVTMTGVASASGTIQHAVFRLGVQLPTACEQQRINVVQDDDDVTACRKDHLTGNYLTGAVTMPTSSGGDYILYARIKGAANNITLDFFRAGAQTGGACGITFGSAGRSDGEWGWYQASIPASQSNLNRIHAYFTAPGAVLDAVYIVGNGCGLKDITLAGVCDDGGNDSGDSGGDEGSLTGSLASGSPGGGGGSTNRYFDVELAGRTKSDPSAYQNDYAEFSSSVSFSQEGDVAVLGAVDIARGTASNVATTPFISVVILLSVIGAGAVVVRIAMHEGARINVPAISTMAAFAVIGIALLTVTNAAQPIEFRGAEDLSLRGDLRIINDASAQGGKAVSL